MAREDLSFGHVAAPPPRRPAQNTSPTRWVIVGAGAVIAGALLALWWMSRAQPDTATPAPAPAPEVALAPRRPERQPMDLPALAASDSMLRDVVSTLSRHPLLARLLATRDLVRAATLAVVQIGAGRTPVVPFAVLKPSTRLQIQGTTSGRIDPASYARWDGPANALQSVSAVEAAQVYVNVKPLFDEAYRELGHPGGDFDEAIVKAIRTLKDTPEVTTDPVLLQRPNYYEHEDPALRSLLPVQKQLILMGPDNRRKVITWLEQIAVNLDLKID